MLREPAAKLAAHHAAEAAVLEKRKSLPDPKRLLANPFFKKTR